MWKGDSELLEELKLLYASLDQEMQEKFQRHVSIGDLVLDRWERAKRYGFGEGTSCYDNVLVLGEVKVGKNCWIGPGVILDGSGGLEIGDNCSISAGVHIYTHDSVQWATSMGEKAIDRDSVKIGSGVYLGPQSIICKGVSIGNKAVIGALSMVREDVEEAQKVGGVPARVLGSIG